MMTNQDALEFACQSARMAFDQAGEYRDSIASFRENLVDTMTDEKVSYVGHHDALAAYADSINRLAGKADEETVAKLMVAKLVQIAGWHNFEPIKVDNGDVFAVKALADVIEACLAVDECTVYFKRQGEPAQSASVIAGLGWNCIDDHSTGGDWDDVMADLFNWAECLDGLAGGAA